VDGTKRVARLVTWALPVVAVARSRNGVRATGDIVLKVGANEIGRGTLGGAGRFGAGDAARERGGQGLRQQRRRPGCSVSTGGSPSGAPLAFVGVAALAILARRRRLSK
jgi:MYXO-CTERM domain-containing protein